MKIINILCKLFGHKEEMAKSKPENGYYTTWTKCKRCGKTKSDTRETWHNREAWHVCILDGQEYFVKTIEDKLIDEKPR